MNWKWQLAAILNFNHQKKFTDVHNGFSDSIQFLWKYWYATKHCITIHLFNYFFYWFILTMIKYVNSRRQLVAILTFSHCNIYPQLLAIACWVKQIKSGFSISSRSYVITITWNQNDDWRPSWILTIWRISQMFTMDFRILHTFLTIFMPTRHSITKFPTKLHIATDCGANLSTSSSEHAQDTDFSILLTN